jgi:hypothetical protein
MLGNQVVVTTEHIGRGFVHLHLDEMAEHSGAAFERPPTGSATVSVPCPTCGTDLTVEICSVAEATRRRGRSRWLSIGAGAAMIPTVALVAITLDTAILSLLLVLLFAVLAYVTLVLVRDAAAPGIYGPWPAQPPPKPMRRLVRRRSRDHTLAIHVS